MSEFNDFARRVDSIAKESFSELDKAEAAVANTERKTRLDYDSDVQRLQAKAAYEAAKEDLRKVRSGMAEKVREMKSIKAELTAAVNRKYALDPGKVDAGALALLQSGIMNANDFKTMIDDAEDAGNITLMKLAAKYAGDAAEKASGKDAAELRVMANKAKIYDGREYLSAFDTLIGVYERCCKTNSMRSYWSGLTEELVESF